MPEATSDSQIATSRIVTSVFDQILGAVRRGELRPGQRISDAQLAEEFGVSRTPVREALVRLRELGIVEASASRFTRVAVIGRRQLVQALVVWAALYAAALDEVIPDASADLIEELERHDDDFLLSDAPVRHSRNPELQRAITGPEHVVRLGSAHLHELLDESTRARMRRELAAAARAGDAVAARASLEAIHSIGVPVD